MICISFAYFDDIKDAKDMQMIRKPKAHLLHIFCIYKNDILSICISFAYLLQRHFASDAGAEEEGPN